MDSCAKKRHSEDENIIHTHYLVVMCNTHYLVVMCSNIAIFSVINYKHPTTV